MNYLIFLQEFWVKQLVAAHFVDLFYCPTNPSNLEQSKWEKTSIFLATGLDCPQTIFAWQPLDFQELSLAHMLSLQAEDASFGILVSKIRNTAVSDCDHWLTKHKRKGSRKEETAQDASSTRLTTTTITMGPAKLQIRVS